MSITPFSGTVVMGQVVWMVMIVMKWRVKWDDGGRLWRSW